MIAIAFLFVCVLCDCFKSRGGIPLLGGGHLIPASITGFRLKKEPLMITKIEITAATLAAAFASALALAVSV